MAINVNGVSSPEGQKSGVATGVSGKDYIFFWTNKITVFMANDSE